MPNPNSSESGADRSIGELLSDLSRDLSTLVRKEIELAKTEMSDKITTVGKDVGFLAGGGLVIYVGLLFILAALAIGLGNVMPLWLSFLIVGLVVAGIGFGLVQKGRSDLKQADLAPRQTIETLKEDKEWAQQQVK